MNIVPVSPDDLEIYFTSSSMLTEVNNIKAQLKKGEMEIFKLGGCVHITCFEHLKNGDKNLVVFCTEGKDYIASCLEMLKIARNHNCNAVAFSTHRKGIVRITARNLGAKIVKVAGKMTYLEIKVATNV